MFGQNDIALIHSTHTENGITDADSRCASAACLPRYRNDADSRSVMPHLGVLSIRVSGNKRYYLQCNSVTRDKNQFCRRMRPRTLFFPFGVQRKPYTSERLRRELYGWDGMGRMGRNIKSVLQFSLYFVGIQIMYVSTYICNQNLSPTFLWVSKFGIKLGSWVMIFKIIICRFVFEKSC